MTGERLHGFNIGITNSSPSDIPPIPTNYQLCFHYEGRVDAGATETIMCNQSVSPRGRYVVVQIPGTNKRLTLCEVKVYGGEYLAHSFVAVKKVPTVEITAKV